MTESGDRPAASRFVAATLAAGRQAGFAATGVADPRPTEYAAQLDAWLARGAHAEMEWLARSAPVRKDPRQRWPWVRSILVGAASYAHEPDAGRAAPGLSRHLARFMRGADYHDELKARLDCWGEALECIAGRPVQRFAVVDTSPVLEREMAVRAGLGWVGKNACLIGPGRGSWCVLGLLLTDLDLPAARQALPVLCGECRACLDACPTGALAAPWFVDARRCVSYLTLEHKTTIPLELHAGIGERLAGCDACQLACPYNRGPWPAADPAFAPDPRYAGLTLADVLALDDARLPVVFGATPLARLKRPRLVRNALIVAANAGDAQALAAAAALRDDPDATIRDTARQVLR